VAAVQGKGYSCAGAAWAGKQVPSGVVLQSFLGNSSAASFQNGSDACKFSVLHEVKWKYSKRNIAYAPVALSLQPRRKTALCCVLPLISYICIL